MSEVSANTSRLFSMPSFARGMARAIDLGSTFTNYNRSKDEETADLEALSSDWRQTGDDLKHAMREYEHGRKE